DMFPHQGFFRQGSCPANAELIEDAQLVNIPMRSFENFLLTNPKMCVKIFRVLGDVVIDLHQRLGEKVFCNGSDQVIRRLMRLAYKNGQELSPGVYRLAMQLTNAEWANMIGTSRETISRSLTKLRDSELMDVDQSGTYIIYLNAMEEFIKD